MRRLPFQDDHSEAHAASARMLKSAGYQMRRGKAVAAAGRAPVLRKRVTGLGRGAPVERVEAHELCVMLAGKAVNSALAKELRDQLARGQSHLSREFLRGSPHVDSRRAGSTLPEDQSDALSRG
jgi:hypothetical protein